MNQDEIRAKLSQRMNAPLAAPVDELEIYLKKLWGRGETDQEVREWLHERRPTYVDGRGLDAWEEVLESEVSEEDLIRLVYAACQLDLEPLDGAKARQWLTERLEWVRGSF